MSQPGSLDLSKLLPLAQAGCDTIWDQLVEQYRAYLLLIARLQVGRRLQGKADASDLVQETFLQAYQHLRDFQGRTESELVAWLRENGLTAGEAALIQPSYDGPPPAPPPDASAASVGYKTTTGVAVGASAVTLALNAARTGMSPNLTGVLGIASGAMGLAAGAPNLNKSGSRRTLGLLNSGMGTASVLLGVYRLTRGPGTASRASVAPWVDGHGVAGASLNVSF